MTIEEPYNIDGNEPDLSSLRGTTFAQAMEAGRSHHEKDGGEDLDALAELVPELKTRASINHFDKAMGMTVGNEGAYNNGVDADFGDGVGGAGIGESNHTTDQDSQQIEMVRPPERMTAAEAADGISNDVGDTENNDSAPVPAGGDSDEEEKVTSAVKDIKIDSPGKNPAEDDNDKAPPESVETNDKELSGKFGDNNEEQNLGGFDDVDSEANALENDSCGDLGDRFGRETKARGDNTARGYPQMSSDAASLSTATQTHEVRMPMYLPTFKPATGCTNASDFIVRCFVARLRSGITVVKHGRSRWCKSRLRILHIHSDGRSLSWKPAVGEPVSNKKPPKLDLSTCSEVRHAWSPDPLNPMFTGTPILRQKCEAANAHKSFALIFPKRTVDITAVTADQCKVLMEGFSALCFRLQVANLAGKDSKKERLGSSGDEEEAETTASVTLTNNSAPQLSPSGSGTIGRKRR